jgi:hypothetical protein
MITEVDGTLEQDDVELMVCSLVATHMLAGQVYDTK